MSAAFQLGNLKHRDINDDVENSLRMEENEDDEDEQDAEDAQNYEDQDGDNVVMASDNDKNEDDQEKEEEDPVRKMSTSQVKRSCSCCSSRFLYSLEALRN